MSVKHLGALAYAPRKRHARHAVAPCESGDTRGGLAVEGLCVDRPFTREHEVSILDHLL